MAAIPGTFVRAFLLCLRRQTLALASADWGLERVQIFIVSPLYLCWPKPYKHDRPASFDKKARKHEWSVVKQQIAFWMCLHLYSQLQTWSWLYDWNIWPFCNTLETSRVAHSRTPRKKHLLPMQGKEASNPSSASWKDPFLDQMLTVGTMLVPVLQANSLGGWRHFVTIFDLGCSIISIFIFWVKAATQMIISVYIIYTYQTNKLYCSLFWQRLQKTLRNVWSQNFTETMACIKQL